MSSFLLSTLMGYCGVVFMVIGAFQTEWDTLQYGVLLLIVSSLWKIQHIMEDGKDE